MEETATISSDYVPPTLVPLGPVDELTLGGGSGSQSDGSGTYLSDAS